MKEIGVGFATRMLAKGLKPRLVISENDGKWAIQSQSTLKTTNLEFTPGTEFDENTPDGRDVKVNPHRSIPQQFISFFHLSVND